MQLQVYIKAEDYSVVYNRKATLGDVLKIECTQNGVCTVIKQMELYRFSHEHAVVFSILKVIKRIHEEYPNAEIINCGEEDFVVEYQKSTVHSAWLDRLKYALIATIVFFGSAFTIMTFHNDIGISETFARFYEQLMGEEKPMVTELEISYSIGLGVGIIVFFNHISKKRLSKDPTPIEIEMQKYNKDLISTKIAEAERKGHKEDVS